MTKTELIAALADFDDDSVVVIGDAESGWSNIGEVKEFGSCISIMQDFSRPFSDGG